MIEEKARVIYEDYISILSPKEVGAHQRSRPWAQRTPSVSGRLARLPLLQNKEPPGPLLIIDLGSGPTNGCQVPLLLLLLSCFSCVQLYPTP